MTLTASVQGQLALLVRLQWIAGRRAAATMTAAPFSAVIVLKDRICWFDRGKDTKPPSTTMPGWCSTIPIQPASRRQCCLPDTG